MEPHASRHLAGRIPESTGQPKGATPGSACRRASLHLPAPEPSVGRSRLLTTPVQTRSITTPSACAASASRSSGSPVRTVPPGSANTTRSASTADPRRARARRWPARRAVASATTGSTSQLLSSRLRLASVRAAPVVDSASTIVGTTGGHRFSSWRASMRAAARRFRWLRRLRPPESSTSTRRQLARALARSRMRRAMAAARARSRADGWPTSATSSARWLRPSSFSRWRRSSASTAAWSSSDAGR